MRKNTLATLGLLAGLCATAGFAQQDTKISDQISQEAGKAKGEVQSKAETMKIPDLAKACAKECPNAKTNDDVEACVEKAEADQGEAAFKKAHKTCYNAHEAYEKVTGSESKEQAGEASEAGESSAQHDSHDTDSGSGE